MLERRRILCQYIAMLCPFCGSNQIFVTNSRPTKGRTQTWRRRRCASCKSVYTTYERLNLSHLTVIKKSGKRQRYLRAKLYSGIYHSSIDQKNVDRGEMSELSEKIINHIEKEIVKLRKKNIHSTEIVEIVLRILRKKEPAFFLRFLAYKEGSDKKKMEKLLRKYL